MLTFSLYGTNPPNARPRFMLLLCLFIARWETEDKELRRLTPPGSPSLISLHSPPSRSNRTVGSYRPARNLVPAIDWSNWFPMFPTYIREIRSRTRWDIPNKDNAAKLREPKRCGKRGNLGLRGASLNAKRINFLRRYHIKYFAPPTTYATSSNYPHLHHWPNNHTLQSIHWIRFTPCTLQNIHHSSVHFSHAWFVLIHFYRATTTIPHTNQSKLTASKVKNLML